MCCIIYYTSWGSFLQGEEAFQPIFCGMYLPNSFAISRVCRKVNFDKSLKLVDQFTYLSSNISSTESDVNILLWKVWTATDKLLNL